jgi:hypothetical protein
MGRSNHSAAILVMLAGVLLAGCGTSAPAPSAAPAVQATIPALGLTPSHAGASAPDRDLGAVSWQEKNYTVTVHTLSADANLISLGFTVADKALSAAANKDILWIASLPGPLTTHDGTQLPAGEREMGWQWSPPGNGGVSLTGTRASFNATVLTTTGTTLDLHLVADLAAEPTGARSYPDGFAPSPQPASAIHEAPIHIDREIRIPFDPRRRLAEPHLSVEGRGVTLTLDRVQVTASETRLYIAGKLPPTVGGGGPQLSGDGWSLSVDHGGLKYIEASRDGNTGQMVYRLGASLLDRPSPWVLTLPAMTETAPPGSSSVHGPWRFRFALPAPAASLTPGPLPSMPPAPPWPTDIPGAEPTFVGPLTGPVPATATP